MGTLANKSHPTRLYSTTPISASRCMASRLAIWTAVNIDGNQLKASFGPGWRRDKRLPANQQTLAEVYGHVPGKRPRDRPRPSGAPARSRLGVAGCGRPGGGRHLPLHQRRAAGACLQQRDLGQSRGFRPGPRRRARPQGDGDDRANPAADDNFFGEGLKGGPWQSLVVLEDRRFQATGRHAIRHRLRHRAIDDDGPAVRIEPLQSLQHRRGLGVPTPDPVIEEFTGLDFGELAPRPMGSVETTSLESARPIREADDIAF